MIDDNGFLLCTIQTNLHAGSSPPLLEWPSDVPRIVKGCKADHAIENGAKLRLSKPEQFRFSGETLISDESENIFSSEVSTIHERSNEPEDMARERRRDAERNRAAELIGSGRRVTTNTVTKTDRNKTKTTQTHGKNGWMWCAALEPASPQEWEGWHAALDPSYDHITLISSPRAFARALAAMVATQLGPRGDQRAKWTQSKPVEFITYHPSQWVFHGPVIYVDDPYSYVIGATGAIDSAVRAAFTKHKTYESQREYRFFVWAHEEPDELTVDLEVSHEMLGSLGLVQSIWLSETTI